ncbi:1-acyl-sn-glycerol-3-phosphate acyltransferase [Botrimarina colliarenosi]|uniref:1-acyl-sn-glycerol-3-phosphate acyltransferase n=1 Tax=Botrimarina colliarenosi TaxID=2528001 RepID=A0A5C6A9E9_9BACT|nr:lysophospholipid acyltransferase family protein [Botrimarina colliarenosi]TWT96066.1 1-acyl-sn-glycerol-3-phosphate acyltransferase [Botrimarina colliarenosi]
MGKAPKASEGTPPTYRRGLVKTFWYWLTSTAIWAVAKLLYGLRTEGRDRVPSEGPVVLLANHTSHFDPPLVGGATRRQLSYLARDTLFVGALGWLISSYDAVPVDRDGSGIAGIKAMLKRLKQGGAMLLFPEGTRSDAGELKTFKPGFVALVRRSRATIVPLGFAGVHEVWPKGASRPRLTGRVAMHYGEPLPYDAYAHLSDDELVRLAEASVRACVEQARALNSRR